MGKAQIIVCVIVGLGVWVMCVACDDGGAAEDMGNTSDIHHLVHDGRGPTDEGDGAQGDVAEVVALGLGQSHGCSLHADATVRCWGDNHARQVDPASDEAVIATPRRVQGIGPAQGISVGGVHNCALLVSGRVACWGDNRSAQLGRASSDSVEAPVEIAGLDGVTALAAGGAFSCAVHSGGKVSCWGDGVSGQLGASALQGSAQPIEIADVLGAVSVSAGETHACAVLTDHTARCWGLNGNSFLGDGVINGTAGRVATVMIATNAPLAAIEQVAMGFAFSCVRTTGGQVYCWGINDAGQLGDSDLTTLRGMPKVPIALPAPATHLTAGTQFACAGLSNGQVYCWGANQAGQLGQGALNRQDLLSEPALIQDLRYDNTAPQGGLAAGYNFACAKTSAGVACWGSNEYNNLGRDVPLGAVSRPVEVVGVGAARAIAAGLGSCVLTDADEVWCWGERDGEVNPTTHSSLTTRMVEDAAQISAGTYHLCARLRDGTLRCWGRNSVGQLGDGSVNNAPAPVQVQGLPVAAVDVSAGSDQTCAALTDGSVWCWGGNTNGELGSSTSGPYTSHPQQVVGLTDAVAVSTGLGNTCALHTDGTISCWGYNETGKLGDGTTTSRVTPARVPGLQGVTQVVVGWNQVCVVMGDNRELWCWGASLDYEDQSLPNKKPVKMPNIEGVEEISSNFSEACARLQDGSMCC
jgi:alpha-tubulin suppressor-like RCC1 family protein